MSKKKLIHPAKSHFPFTGNCHLNDFYISTTNATYLNQIYTAYGTLKVILFNIPTVSVNFYQETVTISSISTTTGKVVVSEDILYKDYYTTTNKAAMSINLVADGHMEFYGTFDAYDGNWDWGSTDVTFSELIYPFEIYN